MRDSVKVFAPATVANLGPGFDILGMAVGGVGDYVTATRTKTPGITIENITGDRGRLPRAADENTASIAAQHVYRQVHAEDIGIRLVIEKGLPLASGLGSSAASAVAGAVAANALLGNPLLREELLPACLEGEAAVSGHHADNVAPALLGGVVLVAGTDAGSIYRLPLPDIHLALVTPAIAVPTAQARAILPSHVPFKDMVKQTREVALLLHALHTGNHALLLEAMGQDHIVEAARAGLIPHLAEAKHIAHTAGAPTVIISGAGPTLCIATLDALTAQTAGVAVKAFYESKHISAQCFLTQPSPIGAYIVEG